MYCSNCGKELPPGSTFCSKCGMKQKRKVWIMAMLIVLGAAVLCIGGFILIDRLTPNHTEDIPSDTAASEEVHTDSGNANGLMTALSDKDIIGMWSTEGPSGELVDPATGYTSGSIYNGEWYLFRDDSTFRYVIIGSGQVLSGGVVWEGRYAIRDGALHLTDIKESWYPNPAAAGQKEAYEDRKAVDVTLHYQYSDDKNTLIIEDSNSFTRVVE